MPDSADSPLLALSGVLLVDKPRDWTSFDVCKKLRGLSHIKKVGHGGTLDPLATGLLPVFFGKSTKLAQISTDAHKEYIAGIKLGLTSDTQDITGTLTATENPRTVTPDEFRAALAGFTGSQLQLPPMHSAVRINGQRLYKIARRGGEVDRPAREVTVFEAEVLEDFTPENGDERADFYVRYAVSKGTYIRTLVHDLGQTLGVGAVMQSLIRTKVGDYTLEQAHSLAEIISYGDTHGGISDLFFSLNND
ncbi:MAG: tRNA pseudouridine(55) synthase TruB [Oscillospiraceae bacterium]|jgi:tRNA pseudouridine55 synthase|nr:tRNA pseudouridine(55) synthase TruB [Oscillospiraceae bacterium]